jgi:hypothetical protein
MGYYSSIDDTPSIKKIEEFEKVKSEMSEDKTAWWRFWEDVVFDKQMNRIWFEETNQKFYEAEEFVKWLNQFEPSGRLMFQGEEGEYWGFEFDNGKVFVIETDIIHKRGVEVK